MGRLGVEAPSRLRARGGGAQGEWCRELRRGCACSAEGGACCGQDLEILSQPARSTIDSLLFVVLPVRLSVPLTTTYSATISHHHHLQRNYKPSPPPAAQL